jgi:tRNA uridine 5-carboxymethylaminomethyl modification enzyme
MLMGLVEELEEEAEVSDQVEIQIKYEGYIQRQNQQIEQFYQMENRNIAEDFNYDAIHGLSREVVQKLSEIRPRSVGQASRISGVTPAAISLLVIALERNRRRGISG